MELEEFDQDLGHWPWITVHLLILAYSQCSAGNCHAVTADWPYPCDFEIKETFYNCDKIFSGNFW